MRKKAQDHRNDRHHAANGRQRLLRRALPRRLAVEYADKLPLITVRLDEHGISKQIFLGVRDNDHAIDYLQSFIEVARGMDQAVGTSWGKQHACKLNQA